MIDFQKHIKRLEAALGVKNASGKNCVDIIDEQLWQEHVMKALNEISKESAEELRQETGKPYPKDSVLTDPNGNIVGVKTIEELKKRIGEADPDVVPIQDSGNFIGFRRNLKYSEAPPTRLLSLVLNLSYWLGYLDASNNHEMHEGAIGAWKRIEKAYQSGKAAHPNSKSNQSNAKTDSD
jgi:hypothetical protein